MQAVYSSRLFIITVKLLKFMTINLRELLETEMRKSYENLTGKTSSDRRWNFFKLLIGIFVGKWIGDTYCAGPRCFDTDESVDISGRDGYRNNKNGDQTSATDDNFQV